MVPTTYVYFLVFIILYLTYTAYNFRKRIWCTFRRADRTKIYKWATMMQGGTWPDVEFEGGWYHVTPARTVIEWKMILGFFPMPVRGLDFRHGSANALNPDTFDSSMSDKERAQLNTSDAIRGWIEGGRKAMEPKGKKGFLGNYMPLLIIIGIAGFGYMLWTLSQRIDMLGNALNTIQQMIQAKK